jgi:DNA-binding NarL/FixJ family response regulator
MTNQPTQILLIDDDPIFRLGLVTALEAFADLDIVAEVDTATAALERLTTLLSQERVNLIILDLALGRSLGSPLTGLSLCQQLKTDYPNLPILLLTPPSEPSQLTAAKRLGVEGYCAKGCAITLIVEAIRQVKAGESYWQMLPTPANSLPPPRWHTQLRQSGLQQIEVALRQVTAQLQQGNLSRLDWLFWTGRRRELLTARWLVNQLLPTDSGLVPANNSNSPIEPQPRLNPSSPRPPVPQNRLRQSPTSALSKTSSEALQFQPSTPQAMTLTKLDSSLANLTDIPLEIDILQVEKRRELLRTVLRKLEQMLDALHFSQVTIEQLSQKRSRLLHDLWQVSLTDFFGQYSTLVVENETIEQVETTLLQDWEVVQTAILEKIPLVTELFANLLFEAPLMIDNVSYPAHTPEAKARAELLLQNLIIQVANGVIQPLLNNFADIEIVKYNFYNKRYMSSREVSEFRNNVSRKYGKYRRSQLIDEPLAIFESRYDLLVLSDIGIKNVVIYSPRRKELEQLDGIRRNITIAYELRDAIAPRLRGTVGWVGKGVVYVLTQVLGRGIGLILRGVIQGVGSAWQDTWFGKNGERGK